MRFLLTVRGLMVLVAYLGICMGASRAHFSLGCFVSTALFLAFVRTVQKISHLQTMELPIQALGAIRVYATSTIIVSTIHAIPLVPLVYIIPYVIGPGCCRLNFDESHFIICAFIFSMPLVYLLKRWLW